MLHIAPRRRHAAATPATPPRHHHRHTAAALAALADRVALPYQASNAWASYTLKCKIDKSTEPELRAYAQSLTEVYLSHERRLARRGNGSFPVSSEQLLKLVHFLPMIPASAKYLNLASFLAKPAAEDFKFLEPLVKCAQPPAAKAAFFSVLGALKTAVRTLSESSPLSTAAAAAIVDEITDGMNRAVTAGGGIK